MVDQRRMKGWLKNLPATRTVFVVVWACHSSYKTTKKEKAMNYEEASAWLKGERSMTNLIPQEPFETWQVRIAEADAAMTQQAYWIVKAHKEALL